MRRSLQAPSAFVAPSINRKARNYNALFPSLQNHSPSTASNLSALLTLKSWSLNQLPLAESSLNPTQLASSLSTILLTAFLLRSLGLKIQSSRILSAGARMSVQLCIMGIFVLTPLFAFASSSPWKIAGWVSVIAILASKEAASRSKYKYQGQTRDCFLAIFGGVGLTLIHLVTCVLHAPFSSSKIQFSAQKIIPIAGMLFGNALSATTLGMSILLSNFLQSGRQSIELRLSRGANVWEASLPVVREAVEAALMPTVNAMAATGLIFMPGMMTGQILGGQKPAAAAAYQIMIYFAIASSSCIATMLLSGIVTARMFDLVSCSLIPWRSIPGLRISKKQDDARNIFEQSTTKRSELQFVETKHISNETTTKPLLQIQQLTVDSINLNVPLLEVKKGNRIGIRGRSGIGKTQLLRTIARLDPVSSSYNTKESSNILALNGQPFDKISPASWRARVIWVSQDRPTLPGTPRGFYQQLLKYRSHSKQKAQVATPIEISQSWSVPAKAWDQPWIDLSGGEAQRVSLAIALSLEEAGETVLLLDEPTSSCDAVTTFMIEKTLIERNVTALIVSHSEEQLNRFCTSTIEIS